MEFLVESFNCKTHEAETVTLSWGTVVTITPTRGSYTDLSSVYQEWELVASNGYSKTISAIGGLSGSLGSCYFPKLRDAARKIYEIDFREEKVREFVGSFSQDFVLEVHVLTDQVWSVRTDRNYGDGKWFHKFPSPTTKDCLSWQSLAEMASQSESLSTRRYWEWKLRTLGLHEGEVTRQYCNFTL